MLRVVAAESDELFANVALLVVLLLLFQFCAALRVLDDLFHLLAIGSIAICVTALGGMDQVRDALLNSFSPLLVRAHRVVLVVAAEQTAVRDFLLQRDIMRRTFISSVVAFLAKVEVAAALAVPARRNSRFADVAGEALGRETVVRIVQRVEETHGRVLRPSER